MDGMLQCLQFSFDVQTVNARSRWWHFVRCRSLRCIRTLHAFDYEAISSDDHVFGCCCCCCCCHVSMVFSLGGTPTDEERHGPGLDCWASGRTLQLGTMLSNTMGTVEGSVYNIHT